MAHPLVQLRNERGLSQNQVAGRAGVSKATVSRIERGWQMEHIARSVRAIAESLDVSVNTIVAPDQLGGFEAAAHWFGLDPEHPNTRGYLEHLRERAVAA